MTLTPSFDIWVDFKDPFFPHVVALREHCVLDNIAEGDTVLAGDYDGNTCNALVRATSRRLVYLELDADTFIYGGVA